LEINNSSLIPSRGKVQAYANNLEILRLSRKYGIPVILGSDAHVSFSIADYKYLWKMIDEANFPKELIMNYWPDEFLAYIS
jgi:putative hydrolase